jgi:hypothetical protein
MLLDLNNFDNFLNHTHVDDFLCVGISLTYED